MQVLYVTSFAPDMYAATGRHLVESFLESGSDGVMLLCHEGGLGDELAREHSRANGKICYYDLDASTFLRDWLQQNRDIIPVALGGTAQPCACPRPNDPFSEHAPRCPYEWYNKNAARWFRKIAALEYALSLDGADAIAWLDSDCRFKATLPSRVWATLFAGVALLYHKSADRKVIESGVIAFRTNPPGRRMLRDVIERYRSGTFRADLRWDDGYQFQRVVESRPEIPSRDLAVRASLYDFVVPNSPLGEYLDHFKGVHGQVLRIMR